MGYLCSQIHVAKFLFNRKMASIGKCLPFHISMINDAYFSIVVKRANFQMHLIFLNLKVRNYFNPILPSFYILLAILTIFKCLKPILYFRKLPFHTLYTFFFQFSLYLVLKVWEFICLYIVNIMHGPVGMCSTWLFFP